MLNTKITSGVRRTAITKSFLHTTSRVALIAAVSFNSSQAVFAADAPATQVAQAGQTAAVEEVVVTGTRVIRDGYEAPTPLTVIGVETLEQAVPANLGAVLNQMPSIAGGTTPQNQNSSAGGGRTGLSATDLRGLGSVRTLVLLDGQRSVGSVLSGEVDINTIPQALVSRVDVVTGGASAAYGSDAVSGVVNFVLDKKFVGVKGEVSGGVTSYGDDKNTKVSLTGGFGFSDDRGHFLISGELAHNDGIHQITPARAWAYTGTQIIINPSYSATNTSVPHWLVVTGAASAAATYGGIIVNGPLKGTAFDNNGTPYKYAYGPIFSDPWTVGSPTWQANQGHNAGGLDAQGSRQGLFTRASYDVTDDIHVYLQASFNAAAFDTLGINSGFNAIGTLTLKTDNAYLPASIKQQAQAAGITSFGFGKFFTFTQYTGNFERRVQRYVGGADGKFDAFDTAWSWNAYYQKGVTLTSEKAPRTVNSARFLAALDSVIAPDGTPVCRSNLTGGNPGCIPIDPFGVGLESPQAVTWVTGTPLRNQHFEQNVEAFSISGEPFSVWAGPVSVATGLEHRRESVRGYVDPTFQSGWYLGNYRASIGAYDVTEGFLETVIPIVKDEPWARSLDFDAAVRFTGYSTSGFVTTYKVGAIYQVIDDIRFRVTRSRDIRAPNLQELFNAGSQGVSDVFDPENGNVRVVAQTLTRGNPALQPEKADTTGLGVVLTPRVAPGFTASVDYYSIDIGNAISSLTAQQILNQCLAEKVQQFCVGLTRGLVQGAFVGFSQVIVQPYNFALLRAKGIDFDASYRFMASDIVSSWNGDLAVHALATHYIQNLSNPGIPGALVVDTAGSNRAAGPPSWRYNLNVTYTNKPLTLGLTARGLSGGTIDNAYVQCTAGSCPVTSTIHETIDKNSVAGALYFDGNIQYEFEAAGATAIAFLSVQNIANKDPATVPQAPGLFYVGSYNSNLYDTLGRVFRGGIRFKM